MVWNKIVDGKLKYFEDNVFVALMKQLESFWNLNRWIRNKDKYSMTFLNPFKQDKEFQTKHISVSPNTIWKVTGVMG